MLLDIIFLLFVITGFISGFRRGLIRSVFGVIALFFGMLLALKYSYLLSEYLWRQDMVQSKYMPLLSFFLIFFAVIVVVNLISLLIEKTASVLFLGAINKIIGGILWAAFMTLLFSTVLWYLDQMHFIDAALKERSRAFPYLITLSPLLIDLLAQALPYFKGMFDMLENFFRQGSAPPPAPAKGIQVML